MMRVPIFLYNTQYADLVSAGFISPDVSFALSPNPATDIVTVKLEDE